VVIFVRFENRSLGAAPPSASLGPTSHKATSAKIATAPIPADLGGSCPAVYSPRQPIAARFFGEPTELRSNAGVVVFGSIGRPVYSQTSALDSPGLFCELFGLWRLIGAGRFMTTIRIGCLPGLPLRRGCGPALLGVFLRHSTSGELRYVQPTATASISDSTVLVLEGALRNVQSLGGTFNHSL
jgi:hypothetical protein